MIKIVASGFVMDNPQNILIHYLEKSESILYKWKIKEKSKVSEQTIICECKSSVTIKIRSGINGQITKLVAIEGQTLKSGDVLAWVFPCQHVTLWRNMCAECGADLKDVKGRAATIAMEHSIPDLLVSEQCAKELGKLEADNLLKMRKLVLLLDLDQTLIHTTNNNVSNQLQDVYHFQLRNGKRQVWYHTKFRPHLRKFLSDISPMFELHICTFGIREYAHSIANLIDPEKKIFQHRILSRDECFHPSLKTLNLKALFPCGDSMVCIVDDREDVWKNAANLVPVKPYIYFSETGDINTVPVNPNLHRTSSNKSNKKNSKNAVNNLAKTVVGQRTDTSDPLKSETGDKTLGKSDEKAVDNTLPTTSDDFNIKKCKMEVEICEDTIRSGVHNHQDDSSIKINPYYIASNLDGMKSEAADDNAESLQTELSSDSIRSEVHHNPLVDTDMRIDAPDDIASNQVEMKVETAEDNIESLQAELVADSESLNDIEIKMETCSGDESRDRSVDFVDQLPNNLESSHSFKSTDHSEKSKGTSDNRETNLVIDNDKNNIVINVNSNKNNIVINVNSDRNNIVINVDNNKVALDGIKMETSESSNVKSQIAKDDEKSSNTLNTELFNADKIVSNSSVVVESSEFNHFHGVLDVTDSDDYLLYLTEILTRIHSVYYDMYDQSTANQTTTDDIDMKKIVPYIRKKVLKGCNLVFSGIYPTNQDFKMTWAYVTAKSLGANIHAKLCTTFDHPTTHLIAGRRGTEKFKMAEQHPGIHIVNIDWLRLTSERWVRQDEKLFQISDISD